MFKKYLLYTLTFITTLCAMAYIFKTLLFLILPYNINYFLTFLAFATIVLLCAILTHFFLHHNPAKIATSLAGKKVEVSNAHALYQEALRITEEIAIQFNTTTPDLYIINANGINIFSVGDSKNRFVIGITSTAISKLDTQTLRALIMHEFYNIINGNSQLNLIIASIIYSFYIILSLIKLFINTLGKLFKIIGKLSIMSFFLLLLFIVITLNTSITTFFFSIFGLIMTLIAIGYTGVLGGSILKRLINSQNKYSADIFAKVCLNNSDNILNAIKEIHFLPSHGVISHYKIDFYDFMFFAQCAHLGFPTHPSLIKRIFTLQPQWNGVYKNNNQRLDFSNDQKERKEQKTNQENFINLEDELKIQAQLSRPALYLTFCLFLSKKDKNLQQKQILLLIPEDDTKTINYIKSKSKNIQDLNFRSEYALLKMCLATLKKLNTEQKHQIIINLTELNSISTSINQLIYHQIIHYNLTPLSTKKEKINSMLVAHLALQLLAQLNAKTSYETYENICLDNGLEPQKNTPIKTLNDIQKILKSLHNLSDINKTELKQLLIKVSYFIIKKNKYNQSQFLLMQLICLYIKLPVPSII